MAHILLNGQSPETDKVQSYLREWGLSFHRLAGEPWELTLETQSDYDVLIFCGVEQNGCDLSWPSSEEEELVVAIPMILIGVRTLPIDPAWNDACFIDELGPDGCLLKEALDTSLGQKQCWGHNNDSRHVFHQYAQFLNHELRTPITATSTALEILVEELAKFGNERLLGFANIGLRNVRRLQRTMTWSEGYLNSRSMIVKPQWQEWNLESLMERATRQINFKGRPQVAFEAGVAERVFESDSRLFCILIQQILHAVRYYAPGWSVTLRVDVDHCESTTSQQMETRGNEKLVLAYYLQNDTGDEITPGQVVRTSLVHCGDRSGDEFLRLLQYTVSKEILDLFQASMRMRSTQAGDEPLVTVTLPFRQQPVWDGSDETDKRAVCT